MKFHLIGHPDRDPLQWCQHRDEHDLRNPTRQTAIVAALRRAMCPECCALVGRRTMRFLNNDTRCDVCLDDHGKVRNNVDSIGAATLFVAPCEECHQRYTAYLHERDDTETTRIN